MALDLKDAPESGKSPGRAASNAAAPAITSVHDLDKQRLRILRCTAQSMASSPGGLRFKAGTRPWLEGLHFSLSASARRNDGCGDTVSRPVAN